MVYAALGQYMSDLKKGIADEMDTDDVTRTLNNIDMLKNAGKGVDDGYEGLRRLRGNISLRNCKRAELLLKKVGVNTEALEEQVALARRSPSAKVAAEAIGMVDSVVGIAGDLNKLRTAKTLSQKMHTVINIGLNHVGSKVPALGPMMEYYGAAASAAFNAMEKINWAYADANFQSWRLNCTTAGIGFLTYRWAKGYLDY